MRCIYCNEPALVRCREHRQNMCGKAYCVSLHRWAPGDCRFYEAKSFDWMKLLLGLGGLTMVITATALAYGHWARIS